MPLIKALVSSSDYTVPRPKAMWCDEYSRSRSVNELKLELIADTKLREQVGERVKQRLDLTLNLRFLHNLLFQ